MRSVLFGLEICRDTFVEIENVSPERTIKSMFIRFTGVNVNETFIPKAL